MKNEASSNQAIQSQIHVPSRRLVDISKGALVQHSTGVYRITDLIDFETVTATEVESNRIKVLHIRDFTAFEPESMDATHLDIDAIDEDEWKVALFRYQAIKPILDLPDLSRKLVEARAEEVKITASTLYRWLNRYKAMDAVSGLLPSKRGWRKGKYRIGEAAETVISDTIRDFYLRPERPSPQKVVREVHRICDARHIERPSPTAIRSRIDRIPEYERLKRRGQAELARSKFKPVPGKFPGAVYPLAVVQIDHTPLDIIFVDDVHRLPINRAWLTLAIDVYSRMVVGYYISFDAPSTTSVAMCIANAMLPKDECLLLHGVEGDWPVWGRPHKIHVDNGSDFRSASLRESCQMYGIDLEFRPAGQPHFGGHIERSLGTLLREIHDIPGTTHSSIKDRGEYDSDKHAVMTKSEFEKLFLDLICNTYHRTIHSAIGMPPRRMWDIGVFGNGGTRGVGMQPRPSDRLTVLLDFLPSFHRTVQTDGVTLDGLRYYADALRPWIGMKDKSSGKALSHIFRRDPRDISSIWFFDPELKQYFKVPFADLTAPSISYWEHQQAKSALSKIGKDPSDEKSIFDSITARRAMVAASAAKTKKARRDSQKRSDHASSQTLVKPVDNKVQTGSSGEPTLGSKLLANVRFIVSETDDIE